MFVSQTLVKPGGSTSCQKVFYLTTFERPRLQSIRGVAPTFVGSEASVRCADEHAVPRADHRYGGYLVFFFKCVHT